MLSLRGSGFFFQKSDLHTCFIIWVLTYVWLSVCMSQQPAIVVHLLRWYEINFNIFAASDPNRISCSSGIPIHGFRDAYYTHLVGTLLTLHSPLHFKCCCCWCADWGTI